MPSSPLCDLTTPHGPGEPDGRETSAPGPGTLVARPASSSQGEGRLRPFPAESAGAGRWARALLTTGNLCDAVSPLGAGKPQGWPHTFLGTVNTVLMGLVTPVNHGQRLAGRTHPPAQALWLQLLTQTAAVSPHKGLSSRWFLVHEEPPPGTSRPPERTAGAGAAGPCRSGAGGLRRVVRRPTAPQLRQDSGLLTTGALSYWVKCEWALFLHVSALNGADKLS